MQYSFLTLIHSSETNCPKCGKVVVPLNTRSYVVDSGGKPVVPRNEYPFPLDYSVQCDCGDKVTFRAGPFDKQPTNESPSSAELGQAVTLETPLS